METSHLQLTPEMRAALSANPDGAVHIADEETRKVYLLVEQGKFPELEEEYIRQGIELAREQINRGEVGTSSIEALVTKAKQSQHSET